MKTFIYDLVAAMTWYKTRLTALVLLISMMFFVMACDNRSTPSKPVDERVQRITGRLNLAAGIAPSACAIGYQGHLVSISNDGTYSLDRVISNGTTREMSIGDTAWIVVGGDTLRDIPVHSWDSVLPTNWVEQRNIGVHAAVEYSNKTVEAVWWRHTDPNGIARVVELGPDSKPNWSSGFIYMVYDDSAYRHNDTLYSLFIRIKSNDSVLAYSTPTTQVRAKTGDLTFDSTSFTRNVFGKVSGLSNVPVDSSTLRVTAYGQLLDTIDVDSLVTHYSSSVYWYTSPHAAVTLSSTIKQYNNIALCDDAGIVRSLHMSIRIIPDRSQSRVYTWVETGGNDGSGVVRDVVKSGWFTSNGSTCLPFHIAPTGDADSTAGDYIPLRNPRILLVR